MHRITNALLFLLLTALALAEVTIRRPERRWIEQWTPVPVFNVDVEARTPLLSGPDGVEGGFSDPRPRWSLGGCKFDKGNVTGWVSIDWYTQEADAERHWKANPGQSWTHEGARVQASCNWQNCTARIRLDPRTVLSITLSTDGPNQWTTTGRDFDRDVRVMWAEARVLSIFREIETWVAGRLASATGAGPIEVTLARSDKHPFWIDVVATRDGAPAAGLRVRFEIDDSIIEAYSDFQGSLDFRDIDLDGLTLQSDHEPNGQLRVTDGKGRSRLYLSIPGPTRMMRDGELVREHTGKHTRLFIQLGRLGRALDNVWVKRGEADLTAGLRCTVSTPAAPNLAVVETEERTHFCYGHVAEVSDIRPLSSTGESGVQTQMMRYDPRAKVKAAEGKIEVGRRLRPNDILFINRHESIEIAFLNGTRGLVMPAAQALRNRSAALVIAPTPALMGFTTRRDRVIDEVFDKDDWEFAIITGGVGMVAGSLVGGPVGAEAGWWLGAALGPVAGAAKKGYDWYAKLDAPYQLLRIRSIVFAEAREDSLVVQVFEGEGMVFPAVGSPSPAVSGGQSLQTTAAGESLGVRSLDAVDLPAEQRRQIREFVERLERDRAELQMPEEAFGEVARGQEEETTDQSEETRQVTGRPWVGAVVFPGTPEVIRDLDPRARPGLVVLAVAREGPAHRSGLLVEDLIVALDGVPAETRDDLHRVLGDKRAGDSLQLEVVRNGEPRTLSLLLGTPPERRPALARIGNAMLGVRVRRARPGEGSSLGRPADRILVVEEINPTAARAGVHPGDVLVTAAGNAVVDERELRQLLWLRQAGDRLELEVLRGEQRLSTTVTLGALPAPDPTGVEEFRRWGFGARRGDLGLQVESVLPDSPAARAGLQPGCIIQLVEGQRASGAATFRGLAEGDHVRLSGILGEAGFLTVLRR